MGVGVARIDGDRTPIRIDGAVQPVVRLENDAEVAVPVRLIGMSATLRSISARASAFRPC